MTIGIPQGEVLPNPTTFSNALPANQSARAIIDGALGQYGLMSLSTQVWNWYLTGRPIEQIMLDLKNTPEYKTRFPAMAKLAAEGRAISENSYINYEQNVTALWHNAGLPADQITEGDYVTKWLEGDVSVNEVNHRIQDLYVQVANTAPEVRAWYERNYPNGDAALAATFADPVNSVPVLERQAASAQFGGAGARFGYDINSTIAEQAAGVGVTAAQAQQGFQQLQQLNPLFNETVSENKNLTAENQGVQAVFGLGQDPLEVERRRLEREALFAGSTRAGGVATQSGFGLGTVQPNG